MRFPVRVNPPGLPPPPWTARVSARTSHVLTETPSCAAAVSIEDPNGYAGNWSVAVFAVCAT